MVGIYDVVEAGVKVNPLHFILFGIMVIISLMIADKVIEKYVKIDRNK